MRSLVVSIFLGTLAFAGFARADLNCEVQLVREITAEKADAVHRSTKKYPVVSDITKSECFHYGQHVLDTALDLYCENGEESVPCQEAVASFWVMVSAENDRWYSRDKSKMVFDACGANLERLENIGKKLHPEMRLCWGNVNYLHPLQTALREELGPEEEFDIAASR